MQNNLYLVFSSFPLRVSDPSHRAAWEVSLLRPLQLLTREVTQERGEAFLHVPPTEPREGTQKTCNRVCRIKLSQSLADFHR